MFIKVHHLLLERMIWAYSSFTVLFLTIEKHTDRFFPLTLNFSGSVHQSDSQFIPWSNTYPLWFRTCNMTCQSNSTHEVLDGAPPSLLPRPHLKGRPFPHSFNVYLPTCVHAVPLCCHSPLLTLWVLITKAAPLPPLWISTSELLPARVRGGSRRLRLCAEWYMGFSLCLKASIEHLEEARCDRCWYDHSRCSVLDMELYRGQPSPSIFATWNRFTVVILLKNKRDMNSPSRCAYVGGNPY